MHRKSRTRSIADDIHRRIRARELLPGTAIPSYRQLATIHGVSVSTVSRAVLVLRSRGIVAGYQGRGVYVVGPPDAPAPEQGVRHRPCLKSEHHDHGCCPPVARS